jgi:transcription elongation factor Elf1
MPYSQPRSTPAETDRPLNAYAPSRAVVLTCPHCDAAVTVEEPVQAYANYEKIRCTACAAHFFLELYTAGDWNCFRLVEEF